MNRWSALAVLLAIAGALALRVPNLDTRPLHNDEAVNAVKVSELWQHGRYVYDPDEYHGPTLHYATLPFLWLSGARNSDELNDATLRLAPVVFGVGLILLLLLFVGWPGPPGGGLGGHLHRRFPGDGFLQPLFHPRNVAGVFHRADLGRGLALCANALGPLGRGGRRGLGADVHDEGNFVLTLAAMGLAGIATAWWTMPKRAGVQSLLALWNWKHAALALGAAFIIWLLLVQFLLHQLCRLAGFGAHLSSVAQARGGHSPHIHPWSFYLQRLAWFHPAKGPVWSEGLILVLAVVGAVVSFVGKKSPLHRFLALYTIILTAIYSAISYKTPWCLLSFFHGMILLAGVGAAALVEFFRARALKVVRCSRAPRFDAATLLAGLARELCLFRRPAKSLRLCADRARPFEPRAKNRGDRARGPAGYETVVKIIAPESDYWPLPWYLRRFKHLGWYEKLPDDPFAPIVMVSSKLDARLDEKSGRKWIMAGLSELRPGNFFELYVELELWKKYVETLPRERD